MKNEGIITLGLLWKLDGEPLFKTYLTKLCEIPFTFQELISYNNAALTGATVIGTKKIQRVAHQALRCRGSQAIGTYPFQYRHAASMLHMSPPSIFVPSDASARQYDGKRFFPNAPINLLAHWCHPYSSVLNISFRSIPPPLKLTIFPGLTLHGFPCLRARLSLYSPDTEL